MPTANWLAAAASVSARPIFVFQMPEVGMYFSSDGAHFPIGFAAGASEPYHADLIAEGGFPTIKRSIRDIYSGRVVVTLGSIKIADAGEFDAAIGDHTVTLRGKKLNGWITYPRLAPEDAVQFLTARVQDADFSDAKTLTLNITDAAVEEAEAARLAAYSYTAANLGTLVKNALTAAGVAYPAGYDTAKWNAWTASGKPGAFTVTGSYSDGDIWSVLDALLADTHSWYGFDRTGLFVIEQFADLTGTPAADYDLSDPNDVFAWPGMKLITPVFRKQTVKYNAGASSVTKTANVLTSDPWWPTAQDGSGVDAGITNVTDATSLATARLTLLCHEHAQIGTISDFRFCSANIGQTVKMPAGDKNLPGIPPQYHRIIEIEEDPNTVGGVKIALWTDLGGPGIV
ncbi:MAG: hypothetical protein HZB29_09775 [Nitrospinae bacterium]|nr:hypothetical protein [Nitrospinota bacterium]